MRFINSYEVDKFVSKSIEKSKVILFLTEAVFDYEFNDGLFEFLTKKYKSGII